MCGIFGSSDYKRFLKLYNKNKDRGSFSFGSVFIDSKLHALIKSPGTFKFDKNLCITIPGSKTKKNLSSFEYYLGHTQAPTSSQRKYTHETTHPFYCNNWFVAHNGVLSNHKQIRSIIKNSKYVNEVDSSLIPALIYKQAKNSKNEVGAICSALSALKGTFGLWIYNAKTHGIYLARAGSTLYANFLTNDFSSTAAPNFKELQEGVLYYLTKEGITSVGEFQTNSPFFTS